MNFIKRIWERIKRPQWQMLLIFYILFTVLITYTLVLVISNPNSQSVLNYILYALSALFLTYFIYTIVYLYPKIKITIKTMLNNNKFTKKLITNYGYRTILFGTISFSLNIAYLFFIGYLAIKTKSVWYMSITAYYLVLTLMKGNVFYYHKQNNEDEKREIKTYRATGIMFIILTLAMSGIIVLIYKSNMYFEYAGLMIYAVALFTFYKITLAIINIFKARKQDNLYIQNIRNINLVSSLVSLLVLQVAMFQAFSPENNTNIANGITGGVVAAIILVLGIYMIVKSAKQLKKLNQGEQNEK